MSEPINILSLRPLPQTLKLAALEPPAWTRMEPVSISGDPSPGLRAQVLDPLWMLGRQWQFGEFQAEDAGTPLAVQAIGFSQSLSAWAPGPMPASGTVNTGRPLGPNHPLEPVVEAEASPAGGVGWRWRAEASQVLLAALSDAGFDARASLLASFPLAITAASGAAGDPPPARLWRTIARSAPDAEAIARSIESAPGGVPAWLNAASASARTAAGDWLSWYRTQVAPMAPAGGDAWIDNRLEYQFAVRAGSAESHQVLLAPLHDGGTIDWSSFDAAATGLRMTVPGEVIRPPGQGLSPTQAPGRRIDLSVLASPVRFPGMPADRLWQFEDGQVNLGRMEVQRHDIARVCFTEFAMIYSNDWYAVPIDVPAGSWVRLTSLNYTTTFGERIQVPPADDRSRGGRFRMFECSMVGSDQSVNGLLVPPTARGTLEGRALEDVMFLRDEGANMAWAVEQTVQGPSGDPRNRSDETSPAATAAAARLPDTDLQYLFASSVPSHWIPLVPVPLSTSGFFQGGFRLRKGTLGATDSSRGALLSPTPFDMEDEEMAREGVRVRRIPAMARGPQGERLRWVARRVSIGRGEGDSQLRYDDAKP